MGHSKKESGSDGDSAGNRVRRNPKCPSVDVDWDTLILGNLRELTVYHDPRSSARADPGFPGNTLDSSRSYTVPPTRFPGLYPLGVLGDRGIGLGDGSGTVGISNGSR